MTQIRARDDEGERFRAWLVPVVAGLTFLNGLLGVAQALLVRFAGRPRLLAVLLPLGLHHWSRSLTAIFGPLLAWAERFKPEEPS